MAKKLIRSGAHLGFLAGGFLGCLIISIGAADNDQIKTMPSTNPAPANSVSDAADSARLAQQIQGLKELSLPYEWDFTKGDTLAARFAATAQVLQAKEGKPLSGPELMARFENGGQPFFYPVWMNQPYRCPLCNNGGAEGWMTVISVARGLSVKITSAEWHAVTAHAQAFPPEKLALLKGIFNSK
jgi:hypothetical protein